MDTTILDENILYIWCDGGVRNNQDRNNNIGGWAALLKYHNDTKEIIGNAKNVTNNQMELQSCIEALKIIKNKNIKTIVTSDSAYLVNGINNWINKWIKNNWITVDKNPVKNKEIWQELFELKSKFKDIEFFHCAGHADNEGNNRVDMLVNRSMDELE